MQGRLTPIPLVWSLRRATQFLAVTLPAALLLLLVEVGDGNRLTVAMIQLGAIAVVGAGLAVVYIGRLDEPWFPGGGTVSERWASAAGATSFVVGVVALLTLASSSALRFEPSLQFLQLVSALDIAWVVAAGAIGATWLFGRPGGLAVGSALLALCLWAVWRYLDVVGFDETGGWLVDEDALRRLVLPYDMVAALVALGSVGLGAPASARRLRSQGVDS